MKEVLLQEMKLEHEVLAALVMNCSFVSDLRRPAFLVQVAEKLRREAESDSD